MQVIFPERFNNLLKRDKKNKNILNLLACGALSSHPQSKEDLKQIVSKCIFLTLDIKQNLRHFFSENFLTKFCASHNPISSLPSHTTSQCPSLSIISYLTASIWFLFFASSKFLRPMQMSFYLNLQLSQHSNGPTLVHTQWEMILHVQSSAQTAIASRPHLWKRP